MGKATLSQHQDRIRPFLANNTFLGRFPGVVIDALVGKGQLRSFAKGDVVYRRGDPGDSLMVVIKGRIKLTNTTINGKEIVLYYVGPGDIFGDIAALDGKERAVDTVALEDSEVFVVYTRDLLPTLTNHPSAMFEVVRALCEKIRIGAAIVEDNTLEMRGRTAREPEKTARRAPSHFQGVVFDDGRADANFFAKRPNDLEHCTGMRSQRRQKVAGVDDKYFRILQRHVAGTLLAVQGRDVSEDVPLSDVVENDLFAINGRVGELDPPFDHHHQAVARIPAPVHDVALGEAPELPLADERVDDDARKPAQERVIRQEGANALLVLRKRGLVHHR